MSVVNEGPKNWSENKFSVLFLSMILLVGIPSSFAVEIKDNRDRVYKGEILDEDSDTYFLDTAEGLISLKKASIVEMDGRLLNTPVSGVPQVSQPGAVSSPGGGGASGPWALKIGSSGLSQAELSTYTRGLNNSPRHANLSGLDWGTKDLHIREAIEDEIAFQEALNAGIHKNDSLIRKNISEFYQARQTLAGVSPQTLPGDEMRSFYEKNKKEFMKPGRYIFSLLQISDSSTDIAKTRSNPQSVTGWRKGGWIEENDSFRLPLSKDQETTIYRLRKGQVSDVIKDSMGGQYLFWCQDYQAPVQKTYEESVERVKHLMMKNKQAANTQTLHHNLKAQAPGKTTDAALFDAAMKAGVHRDRHIRDQIINTYLQKSGKTLGSITQSVKDRYPVEIKSL